MHSYVFALTVIVYWQPTLWRHFRTDHRR